MDQFTNIHKPLNLAGFENEGESKNQKEPSLSYVSPSLEKGHLADMFGYRVGTQVSGKQIKEGVDKVLKYVEKEIPEKEKSLKKKLEECGNKPDREVSKHTLRGLEPFLPKIPKVFGPDEASYGNACYKYNDCVRELINCYIERVYAKSIMNAIKEDQKYHLNIKEATTLGIGIK